MNHLKSKKAFGLLVVLVVGGIAAFGAYAFFSSSGTGSGTATVGSSSGIEITSSSVGDLYPGGADVPVDVTIHNTGNGDERVGTITGTVEDITSGPNAGCMGSWFTVDPIDYNAYLSPVGGPADTDTTDTDIRMTETFQNQDACQGATLTIDWSSN